MPKSSSSIRARSRNVLVAIATLFAVGCGSSNAGPGTGANSGGADTNGSAGSSAGAGTSAVGGAGGAVDPAAGAPSTAGGGTNGVSGAPSTAGTGGQVSGAGAGGSTGGAGAPGAATGDLWVALDGSDTNPGTEAKPLLNLATATTKLTANHTVFIKAGTYKYTAAIQLKKSGLPTATFTVSAAPGTRPVIDFATPATVRGFEISGDYWHLVGFEVENASDNCIAISGSHNTIENLTIHGCGDTGLQITVGTAEVADATRGAYNLILNTDSYENLDVATGGENADGFAAKLRIGAGNVFRGCRAYNNADDGWDFFAADDVVEIDGSWAFSNGKGVGGENPSGDGNGFKLGGKPTSVGEGGAVHLVKDSFAFENLACGYTQNSNPDVPKLSNCGAKDNQTDFCQTLSKSGSASMTMTAAQAKAVKRNADGSLPPMK
jgi:pectate disaccharide-lyase